MSRTTVFIGSFGVGKTMPISLSECIKDVLSKLQESIEKSDFQCRNSFVLDVMRRDGHTLFLSECNQSDITVFSDSERFSRRFTLDGSGYDMAVLPYLPAHICIFGRVEVQIVSLWICSMKEDRPSSGKDATEKQSNELFDLSIPMVHLWRDRRHRRKRDCNLWSVPWKLNSNWNCDNAWGRSAPRCA